MPHARVAAGKPATGVISLEAYHKGGNIVVDVCDDGGGLQRDRILAKARERGLVGAEAELSDEQVAGVLNWLVREFSPAQVPADFTPFTSAEVSQHRRPPLVDVARVRTELLQAIQATEAAMHHEGVSQ